MDRPEIRTLVCWFSPAFGIIGGGPPSLRDTIPSERVWPKVMSLEDAVDFAQAGFAVLVDPRDERDLAMHERFERAIAPQQKKKWFER